MNARLLEFHKKCTDEYRSLLGEFNILFYGYGCKRALLKEIFPEAFMYNMNDTTLRSILEDLNMNKICSKQASSLVEMDLLLQKTGKTIILVLINFDFSILDMSDLQSIRVVATLETIDLEVAIKDILAENFIFRDLTTFIPYTEETIMMNLAKNRIEDVITVARHMTPKALVVFAELLKLGECTNDSLFKVCMPKLMITRKQVIRELLSEFIDHKIVNIKEGGVLSLHLSKDQRQKLLNSEFFAKIIS